LGTLVATIGRPAVCSIPLLVGLFAAHAATSTLPDGIQLLVLVICGAALYVASTLALARGELRAITAAFRSS